MTVISRDKAPATYEKPVGANLIPVVNKLQEVCSLVGEQIIDLPQIVVIGGQSSGKSSVLENLVGRDFLPRGAGLVTRVPLILQLNPTEEIEEWGEFSHKPGRKFSFNDIRGEIENETDRITGTNKGISSEPIILKVYSPNVLPLTLVDTPGMTRVPIGDQPADIELKIRDMVHRFISQPNAIVLAVQAANVDLATSDALKLAREVDLPGERTVGVLTKLDIMDKGTDALNILLGKTVPLKLGFVGVISRSQHDILVGKSIKQMLQDEEKFFKKHPIYHVVADQCGTKYLAQKCNRLLSEHIYRVLPNLRNQIRKKIKEKQEELQSYGQPVTDDKASQGWLLLHLLNKFGESFRAAIDGVNSEEISTNELNGGARIRYIFQESFIKHLEQINPLQGLDIADIKTAIKNAAGPRPALFIPEKAFEMLIKKQIELLKEPSLRCAELVYDELLRIVTKLDLDQEISRFGELKTRVIDVASTTLRKTLKPTNKMIEDLIKCETAYINTQHPDFVGFNLMSTPTDQQAKTTSTEESEKPQPVQTSSGKGLFGVLFGGGKAATKPPKTQDLSEGMREIPRVIKMEDSMSDRDKAQIQLIKQLLTSYFAIVRKNLQDSVVKIIMHFLVNSSKENLQRDLVSALYKEEYFEALLQEDPRISTKRRVGAEHLDALKRAKKIVQAAEVESTSN